MSDEIIRGGQDFSVAPSRAENAGGEGPRYAPGDAAFRTGDACEMRRLCWDSRRCVGHCTVPRVTEQELHDAREWLTRLLDGVVNANAAAESVALAAYRDHGQ